MQVQENQAGGESVILSQGDDLDRVPESHRDCITSAIQAAFGDPAEYFHSVADRCKFPLMIEWLRKVTTGPWRLCLHDGRMFGQGLRGGFYFKSDRVLSATVYPAVAPIQHQLKQLAHYYELIDAVHWDSFGCSGGLFGSSQLCGLSGFGLRPKSKQFPAKSTFVWGNSSCGDALICTDAGNAGFLSHETGEVHLLGTIDKAIEWVFGELLKNRTPEFDYG